jgi:hypothetical protein
LLPAPADSLLRGITDCLTPFMPVVMLLASLARQNREQLTPRQRLYYRITLYGSISYLVLSLFAQILP